jgi:hypothetical protein
VFVLSTSTYAEFCGVKKHGGVIVLAGSTAFHNDGIKERLCTSVVHIDIPRMLTPRVRASALVFDTIEIKVETCRGCSQNGMNGARTFRVIAAHQLPSFNLSLSILLSPREILFPTIMNIRLYLQAPRWLWQRRLTYYQPQRGL